jgi:hypothetical protein
LKLHACICTLFDSIGCLVHKASEYSKKKSISPIWLIALPFIAFAAWRTARIATADSLFRHNTLDSVREAVALDPGSAAYHELLAEHLLDAGKLQGNELTTAVELSPMDSHYWIRLGFEEEAEGDNAGAERDLLKAAAIDRMYGPRWALMNYYFRQGNQDQFWIWTKSALKMSYGDLTPIFRLCWLMSQDEAQIRSVIPVRRNVLVQYLEYLIQNGHADAAAPVAQNAAELASTVDVSTLMGYCDFSAGRNDSSALAVWNTLCRRKLLPFQALDPTAGGSITNGNFSVIPTEHGLDWRIPPVEGVSVQPDANGIKIIMSGKQPEECSVLIETIPLSQGREYRLRYEYASAMKGVIPGLHWIVRASASQQQTLAQSDAFTTGADWNAGQMNVAAGSNNSATLILHYQRAPGTVRWQGDVTIRLVASELVR